MGGPAWVLLEQVLYKVLVLSVRYDHDYDLCDHDDDVDDGDEHVGHGHSDADDFGG